MSLKGNLQNTTYQYKGAIHIHTKLSDGTGDIKSISRAAKRAGLDWIIITDHNHYDNEEGFYNGVCVIKGEELSPKSCNHYLALGINAKIENSDNASINANLVRLKGGFGFAAHPDEGFVIDEEGNLLPRKNSHHCIPWTDKNIRPDGIEIWNWFSNWADNLDDRNICRLAYSYFFKHKIVGNPSVFTLNWWDKLNNESKLIVPAIGGVDAHALKFYKYIIPVTVFPYETCFKTITNIVNLKEELSSDFITAKKQLLQSVIFGNNIIINRNVYKNVPDINVSNNSGSYYCGDSLNLDCNTYLNFKSEKCMKIRILNNGVQISELDSKEFHVPITKCGKYRLELFYKGHGFGYTNPFNIKEEYILND